jgi:CheY-like chemotaxis protein
MRDHNPSASASQSQGHILLVEDNEAAGTSLARHLELHGYTVEIARNGTTALQRLAAGPPPEFLLTDLLLPDLDGREIAHQAALLNPRPRVGLITGWQGDLEPDDLARSGIDWIILKPVSLPDLFAKLGEKPTDRR